MSAPQIVLLACWVITIILWSQTIWGSWAGRVYERVGSDSIAWYWLRVFGMPRTKENCIRFLKRVCLGGMVLFTLGVVASFAFAN